MDILSKIKALINKNFQYHKDNQDYLKELDWANIFHDSIRGKKWLEDLPLNIGRWAGNYAFFYVLNRILNDYKPKSILEFGLGESSKFITSYLKNSLKESNHLIIEQNEEWSKLFLKGFSLSSNSKIEVNPLIKKEVKGYKVNSYSNLNHLLNKKFDLYVVDGPFGSPNYSRYQIVEIAENFSKLDEFVIILDDYQRRGEQETVSELLHVLESKEIKFYKGLYSGNKSVLVIGTEKYKYIESL